jgi:hypothetical protein
MEITPLNNNDQVTFAEAWAALPANVQRMLEHLRVDAVARSGCAEAESHPTVAAA